MKGIRFCLLEDKPYPKPKDSEMLVVDLDKNLIYIHMDPFEEWLEGNGIKDYKELSLDEYIIVKFDWRRDWVGISIDLLIKTEKNPEFAAGLEKIKEKYLNEVKDD